MEKKTKGKDAKLAKNDNVKPCPNPKCNTPTTKISGCMYLHCSSCREYWCWQCGDWGGGPSKRPQPHHVYDCNNPINRDWLTAGADMFTNDGRWAFYFERYNNHAGALKFAEKQVAEAQTKMDDMKKRGESSFDVQFLKDSAELVADCRYVLQHSYVYAFFEKDDRRRTLFEFAQKDLETYTGACTGRVC